jgi:hypothetical protein
MQSFVYLCSGECNFGYHNSLQLTVCATNLQFFEEDFVQSIKRMGRQTDRQVR